MNNHRLLTRLLITVLSGTAAYAHCESQTVFSIERLFEIAETNSVQLRPSFTSEEEAAREISVARSHRLPDIKTNLTLSYIGDGFTTRRDFTDLQKAPIPDFGSGFSINVYQPVYSGGAIKSGIEMAELKSAAAGISTEMHRDNIRFRIVELYLELYKCSNLRSVVVENIDRARKVLEEMHARYQQGVALQNDITRYELLVSNLELELVKIDNMLDIVNHTIVVTAGLDEGTVIMPDTTILERSLPAQGERWWMDAAEHNSPRLKMARSEVEINRKAESLAKSELLPKVGLQARWTIDGPILVEVPPVNRNLSYWFVGIGVDYNLSSLYKGKRSLEKSRVSTILAKERLAAECENVNLDVRSDYIRYLESYEELKTQEKSVELAHRNYLTVSTRYYADMALITDLLDAASARLEAEQRLVNAHINIIYYYYKLLFTSGKI